MEATASAVLAWPASHAGVAMRKRHTHLSDEALVALVARDDEDALAELYDRVGRAAYGLALRVLRDERHAEDAVQEAFLQVWRSAATFTPERAKASTWILTLVHRRAVDLVRREQRRQAEPLADDAAGVAVEAEQTDEAAWLRFERERVQTALKRLPTSSARRSSSRTTAASRSPSSRRGSEYRWARSRAGCSRGSTGCASCSTNPHRKGHGNRNSRADRGLRARRARSRGAERLRGAPRGLRAVPPGAQLVLGDDGGARSRGLRTGAQPRSTRADPRRCSSRDPTERRSARVAAKAARRAGAGRRGGDRGSRRTRARAPCGRSLGPTRRHARRVRAGGVGRRRSCRSRHAVRRAPGGRWAARRRCGRPSRARPRRPRPRSGRQDLRDVGGPGRGHRTGRAGPGSSPEATVERSSRSTGPCAGGDVVAVTVEPAGGVDAPTTQPVVASDSV